VGIFANEPLLLVTLCPLCVSFSFWLRFLFLYQEKSSIHTRTVQVLRTNHDPSPKCRREVLKWTNWCGWSSVRPVCWWIKVKSMLLICRRVKFNDYRPNSNSMLCEAKIEDSPFPTDCSLLRLAVWRFRSCFIIALRRWSMYSRIWLQTYDQSTNGHRIDSNECRSVRTHAIWSVILTCC